MTKIYSMAANDCVVPVYASKGKGDVAGGASITDAVVIKGGANVTDPKTLNRNVKFVVTEVNAKELEILKASASFMRKVERGFITIGKEPADLKKDKSAQLTESDVKGKNKDVKVVTGGYEE